MKQKSIHNVFIVDALIGNDYALCLSRALAVHGLGVSLIVPENREVKQAEKLRVLKWIPSKDPSRSKIKKVLSYSAYFIKLMGSIINDKPEAVHFQFFRTRFDVAIFLVIKLLPVKLVYTAHNVLPHEHRGIDMLLNSFIYKAADSIIVHSNYIKNKLLGSFRVNGAKVWVIPHGSFDHYLPPQALDKEKTRTALGIKKSDNIILFFGYIREYKGLDLLLDAYKYVRQQCGEIKLLIAGSPQTAELKEKYLRHIKSISANGNIIAHFNFIPDDRVADYFVSADLVILPYKAIDHSGLIHLAYSFGKPVIAAKVGDFPETVIDGRTGYLLKENTPAELARTIIESFSRQGELEEMGSHAKQLSDTLYAWDKIAGKTIKTYGEE